MGSVYRIYGCGVHNIKLVYLCSIQNHIQDKNKQNHKRDRKAEKGATT